MYNERMPRVGESILFFANSNDEVALSNGKKMGDPVAAIVTQPWSAITVNLKLIPDHAAMQDRGSVSHKSAMPEGGGYYWLFPDEYYGKETEKKFLSVLNNATGFHAFLDEEKIEYKPSGHYTLVAPDTDLFSLGVKYEQYKSKNS